MEDNPGKVDEMYMENLEEWILEENKIVTYKYLSRALKCHVNVAKQMLFNFLEEQKKKGVEMGVVYLLSGFCKPQDDGVRRMKVCLVKHSDLEKASSRFDTVTSKHIYSLSKTEESVNPTAMYATDYAVFKEDVFSGNALTAVKNKMAVPRSAEEVRKPPPPVAMVKQEVSKVKTEVKAKPKSGIESAFAKAAKKSPENKEVKKEESGKKAAAGSGKKPGGIANFFAKQAAKPLVEKKDGDKEKENKKSDGGDEKEKISSDTSPGKENIENQNIEQKKEDESKNKDSEAEPPKTKEAAKKVINDKKSNKKKPAKDNDDSKKRKRIQVMSDSDESEDEKEQQSEVMEECYICKQILNKEEVAPPQAALIESDDDEIIPGTPKVEKKTKPGRKRVKKLIDKTFIDDKGYMVTKKVYESGSETDNEPSPVKKPVKPVPKDSPPPPAAKKAKIMAPGNKQQGIMSFFKKK